MSILGLGADIVNIRRIKDVVSRFGDKFAKRILCDLEWEKYLLNRYPIRFLAKTFAVKEAAAKAFGTGIGNGITFKNFEVFKDKYGKPYLRCWQNAALILENIGVIRIHLTLTDEAHYVYALVIIEN
ncbi:MAG: holo-ACP synthase [Candidatus Dasytiphilus stammeri]